MSGLAKPMLPLTGLPWQHSNASQSGRDKYIMDNPPLPPNASAQPWPYLSMYMLDINSSIDTSYMFTWELCEPKTTKMSTSKKSPDESPQNAFKSLCPKCLRCLWSSTLVSQPVHHVSSFLVLVQRLLVPNGTSYLIKTFRDCSCVMSTSDSAQPYSSGA